MTLATDDRLAIHELIALHGHLMDDREFSRLSELVTEDVVYDIQEFGLGVLRGRDQLLALVTGPLEGQPIAHHATNIMVLVDQDGTVRVKSKGLAVMPDGKAGSAVYQDIVVKTEQGWRLAHRVIHARRAPRTGA